MSDARTVHARNEHGRVYFTTLHSCNKNTQSLHAQSPTDRLLPGWYLITDSCSRRWASIENISISLIFCRVLKYLRPCKNTVPIGVTEAHESTTEVRRRAFFYVFDARRRRKARSVAFFPRARIFCRFFR